MRGIVGEACVARNVTRGGLNSEQRSLRRMYRMRRGEGGGGEEHNLRRRQSKSEHSGKIDLGNSQYIRYIATYWNI